MIFHWSSCHAYSRQHLPSQNRIDPRLIAFALRLQPLRQIGIHLSRNLPLYATIETPAFGVFPFFIGHFGSIAEIDLAVGPRSESFQIRNLFLSQFRQGFRRIANHLHTQSLPQFWLNCPRELGGPDRYPANLPAGLLQSEGPQSGTFLRFMSKQFER